MVHGAYRFCAAHVTKVSSVQRLLFYISSVQCAGGCGSAERFTAAGTTLTFWPVASAPQKPQDTIKAKMAHVASLLQLERSEAGRIVFHMPMLLNLSPATLSAKMAALADMLGLDMARDGEEVRGIKDSLCFWWIPLASDGVF